MNIDDGPLVQCIANYGKDNEDTLFRKHDTQQRSYYLLISAWISGSNKNTISKQLPVLLLT